MPRLTDPEKQEIFDFLKANLCGNGTLTIVEVPT